MKRSLIVLKDGSEVFSGTGELPAIKSLSYRRTAVSTTDFFYGSACAATVDVSVIEKSAEIQMSVGDEFDYYEVDQDGTREKIGRFICTTAKRSSPYAMKFSAHDRMTRFDVDISIWLAELTEWPYTINQLLQMTADYCGVEIDGSTELINGEHQVQRFIASVTARKLLQWICEANACFAIMNENGILVFGELTDRGALTADVKKASVEDYCTKPIARVVVKQTEEDIGTRWPDVEGETYEILRNPLLAAFSEEEILPAIENIAGKILGLTYTPAKVELWEDGMKVKAGDVFSFQVGDKEYKTIAFSENRTGSLVTLKSSGASSRSAPSSIFSKNAVDQLQGRITEIKATLGEISTRMEETTISLEEVREESSTVKQTTESLELTVSETKTKAEETASKLAALEVKSSSVEISIQKITSDVSQKADRSSVEELTEKFRFDENGMTIFNSATGMGVEISEEKVAFTGGNDEPTTQITPTEMETTNLQVQEQLDIKNFSFIPRTNGNMSVRWTGG